MRPRLLVLALALFVAFPAAAQMAAPASTPTVFDDPALVQRYQQTITADDLAAHLYFFASDYFEGRETSARGQKLAALYLASVYKRLGVAPKGSVRSDDAQALDRYLQPFPLYGRRLTEAKLTASRDGSVLGTAAFGPQATDSHALLLLGGRSENTGGLAFAGYGIKDAEAGYDDYQAAQEAGLDFAGKWVMILDGEPMQDGRSRLTADGTPSTWSTEQFAKVRAAFQHATGMTGLLVVSRDEAFTERASRAGAAQASTVGSLSLNPPEGEGRVFPPVYHISEAFANTLLAPSGQTVAGLAGAIAEAGAPVAAALEGVEVRSTVSREVFSASSENVAAFIEGSDPALKDEVVVLSSHYDHIGINPAGNSEGDVINNGADDDGSGTVAILEIAEAFMQAKADGHGPRRSILLLNVSGEEKGLLGSAYYSDVEPLVPIEQTVTNLNLDMVGRRDPNYEGAQPDNYIYIIGSNLISQELHDINARVNELTGTDVELSEKYNSKDDPNQFYRRSDHWNFGKKGVPFIFYFNGTHEDYHGLGDEPQKIDYPQMESRTRLIFATAWQVANQDARPAVSGEGFN